MAPGTWKGYFLQAPSLAGGSLALLVALCLDDLTRQHGLGSSRNHRRLCARGIGHFDVVAIQVERIARMHAMHAVLLLALLLPYVRLTWLLLRTLLRRLQAWNALRLRIWQHVRRIEPAWIHLRIHARQAEVRDAVARVHGRNGPAAACCCGLVLLKTARNVVSAGHRLCAGAWHAGETETAS